MIEEIRFGYISEGATTASGGSLSGCWMVIISSTWIFEEQEGI